MIDITGDLWQQDAEWLCITTNPIINKQGRAVMGRGVALEAATRYPHLPSVFAQKISEKGNVVQGLCRLSTGQLLISFPVKHHWKEDADLELIEYSARQLISHWHDHGNGCDVVIPRPGCGNGRLSYDEVRPILSDILTPDSFKIITY